MTVGRDSVEPINSGSREAHIPDRNSEVEMKRCKLTLAPHYSGLAESRLPALAARPLVLDL